VAFSKEYNGIQLNLRGVIPPMVTPFKEGSEEVDHHLLALEAKYIASTGVHAICVTGSTGEGQGLTEEEIFTIVQTVVNAVGPDIHVIGGVIADTTRETIQKGLAAKRGGAKSLQITPPHYLWAPSVEGLVQHFKQVGEAVELPLLIYNVVPWVDIDVHAMSRIIDEAPWVLGVKQSGGDMHKVADMMAVLHDRVPITSGIDDLMYPTFVLGVDGVVSCLCAVFPELTQELFEAVQDGEHDKAKQIHSRLLPVWRTIEGNNMTAKAKYAIGLLGREVGVSRGPILAPDSAQKEAIRRALEAGDFI
jgi:4-hydroxy-tetrahydrodipicolinate synthase